jgi:hypothetical protein
MTTKETRVNESMLLVEWFEPLFARELDGSFQRIAQQIDACEGALDVVFDISHAGHIPVEAPTMAIRSGFLADPQTRNVVVVGMDNWAQILARVASRATGKPIIFYRTYEEAAKAISWIEIRAS